MTLHICKTTYGRTILLPLAMMALTTSFVTREAHDRYPMVPDWQLHAELELTGMRHYLRKHSRQSRPTPSMPIPGQPAPASK